MAKPRHIKNILHKDNCEYLTAWLHQCVENKEAINDTQCPKSWAMGHHPVTDKLLEEMTSRMEEETGKKLFPTYAYARLYQKGEILECHADREACEYSATITLGFGGDKIWPIFAADRGEETDAGMVGENGQIFRIKNVQEFELNVGDALVYQGGLSPHWREEFLGS